MWNGGIRRSNSNVSNNVLMAANRLAIPRVNVAFVKPCRNMLISRSISDSASIMRDLLYTRCNNLCMPKGTEFLRMNLMFLTLMLSQPTPGIKIYLIIWYIANYAE